MAKFAICFKLLKISICSSGTRRFHLDNISYRRCRPFLLASPSSCQKLFHSSSSDSGSSEEDTGDNTLPGRGIRAKKSAAKQEVKSSEQALDQRLAAAVDKVTESLPTEEQSKVRSDLLQRLQDHSDVKAHEKSTSLSAIFAGMRVENDGAWRSETRTPMSRHAGDRQLLANGDPRRQRGPMSERRRDTTSADRRNRMADVHKLFDGPSLGVFPAGRHASSLTDSDAASLTLYNKLWAQELSRSIAIPPTNAFDEMIRWTQEGKLWHFPIDNEQGLDEEAKVGFHEHVFLDQFIDDRFPSQGPVRHFMELVATGLSKNPFLTVAEKHAHIDWYAEYFKDKYKLIEDSQSKSQPGDDSLAATG